MLDKYLIEILNIHLPNRHLDVSKLYYDRKYGNAPAGTRIDLSFASIRRDLHLPMLPQHDAFNDALSAAQMYVILKDMIERQYLAFAATGITTVTLHSRWADLGLRTICRGIPAESGHWGS